MSYLIFRQPLPPDHVGATLNHEYLEKFEYKVEQQYAELVQDVQEQLNLEQKVKTIRSLTATSEQLKALDLKHGPNDITFTVKSKL